MDIRLINLDRSTDRLATFQAINKQVMPHVTRFSAIDGQKIERAAVVERGIIVPDLAYKDGALGSALSQIALWDTAIREDRCLTICEDDAIFNYAFCAGSASLLHELPADWHLIKWGWNFDSMISFDMIPGISSCTGWFDQESLRKGIYAFQSTEIAPRAYKFFQAFGTVCYSISPAGARLLRQNCLPLRNTSVYVPALNAQMVNYCIDVALNGIFAHMNCFLSIPPLVVTRNDHSTSTIQQDRWATISPH